MTDDILTRRNLLLAAAGSAANAQTQPKIRIAYIGTGHRAWGMIGIMKTIPDCEIVAIADPTPSFRDRGATLAGPQAKVYSDYRTLLAESKDIDAVVVAAPGRFHPEHTIAALHRGIHVLCEKPMALSIEEANRMIAAADKSGKILQLDQQYRLRRDFSKLKEVVAAGEIGAVKFVSAYLHRGDWNAASWKTPHPKTGVPTVWRYLKSMTGSSLMEDGIHELDVLHWVIGAPVDRVYAAGGNCLFTGRETIDHATVIVEYQNGVKMQFGFTLIAGGGRVEPMMIAGDKATLYIDDSKITIRHRTSKQPVVIDATEPEAPGTRDNPAMAGQGQANYLSMKSFLDNIRNETKPALDGRAGKEALRVPLLAQKSIDERRVVTPKDLPA
jgi:predicted dehydrogenase